ncbi:hypothetical protein BH24CHL6_BH24CHL6_12780 [soil metagenome]
MSSFFVRRLLPALLVVLLAGALAPPPVAQAQGPTKAEARLHSLINSARASRGLAKLRWHGRLADVAQYRSNDMVRRGYFAHPSRTAMARLLRANGVRWSRWAETLAWNSRRSALVSANYTFRQWRNSRVHWSILTSSRYNYVGIGLARTKSGRNIWTAVLIRA